MKAMRARKPDNAVADREFSAKVLGRDGRVCRAERWNDKLGKYVEHGVKSSPENPIDAAHIHGRPHLSPGTRYNPLLGCAMCRNCHEKYDAHDTTVRVPLQRYDTAQKYLERAQQLGDIVVMPPPRIPPKRPTE